MPFAGSISHVSFAPSVRVVLKSSDGVVACGPSDDGASVVAGDDGASVVADDDDGAVEAFHSNASTLGSNVWMISTRSRKKSKRKRFASLRSRKDRKGLRDGMRRMRSRGEEGETAARVANDDDGEPTRGPIDPNNGEKIVSIVHLSSSLLLLPESRLFSSSLRWPVDSWWGISNLRDRESRFCRRTRCRDSENFIFRRGKRS